MDTNRPTPERPSPPDGVASASEREAFARAQLAWLQSLSPADLETIDAAYWADAEAVAADQAEARQLEAEFAGVSWEAWLASEAQDAEVDMNTVRASAAT